MKKVVLFFPLLAVLVLLMGCGNENIKIAGEDEAWKVCTYPSNNMSGIAWVKKSLLKLKERTLVVLVNYLTVL